jgi:hypothetical protein
MSVILLILGIAVVAAGVTTIAFGIPINESPLGTALIIAGTTALTGGLTLIGLLAVVARLRRLTEGLGVRPAARSARAAEVKETVQPMIWSMAPVTMPAPVVAAPAALQGVPQSTGPQILPRPEAPQPENSDKFRSAQRQADYTRRAERVPGEEARTAAIVKSGVVDGTAYTVYADGSVDANLPGGTARFNSIVELRAHIAGPE